MCGGQARYISSGCNWDFKGTGEGVARILFYFQCVLKFPVRVACVREDTKFFSKTFSYLFITDSNGIDEYSVASDSVFISDTEGVTIDWIFIGVTRTTFVIIMGGVVYYDTRYVEDRDVIRERVLKKDSCLRGKELRGYISRVGSYECQAETCFSYEVLIIDVIEAPPQDASVCVKDVSVLIVDADLSSSKSIWR